MNVTVAESEIMDALWRGGAMTADEIVADVRARMPWGEATVKTLINRLLKKKAIKSERADGRHSYRSLLQRAEYVQAESEDLLGRLFGGQVAPLVAHFAEHRKLTPEEVARLKSLIEALDDGG